MTRSWSKLSMLWLSTWCILSRHLALVIWMCNRNLRIRQGRLPEVLGLNVAFPSFSFLQMDLGIPAMTKCCNQLDVCYETCGANKYRCDAKFRWCLHSICSDLKRSLGFVSNVEGRYLKCIDPWAESLVPIFTQKWNQSPFTQRDHQSSLIFLYRTLWPMKQGGRETLGNPSLEFLLSCPGAAGTTPDGRGHTKAFPEDKNLSSKTRARVAQLAFIIHSTVE